jgi:hypothetical protein
MHMRRLLQLLSPSLLSGSATLLLALGLIAFNAWSYIEYRQFYYDFLFGIYGIKTTLLTSPDHFAVLRRAIVGNGKLTYYVFLLLGALLAGFTTYTVIGAISKMKRTADDIAIEMHQRGIAFQRTVDEEFLRLGIRVACLIAWAIYLVLWLNVLVPYSTFLLEDGIDAITQHTLHGWIFAVISYVILIVGIHLHVIFLRLTLLRTRVFGVATAD